MQRARSYSDNFTITSLIKNTPRISGVFLGRIKNKVLGKKYELSLVFVGPARSRKLNRLYRKKDKVANVLSFSVSRSEGEIFLSVKKKEEILSLFIHALCHLKGHRHGSRMESEEKTYRKFFNI